MAATSKMYLSLFIYSVSVFQLSSAFEVFQQKVIVNSSELSILIITPALFGWDIRPGIYPKNFFIVIRDL